MAFLRRILSEGQNKHPSTCGAHHEVISFRNYFHLDPAKKRKVNPQFALFVFVFKFIFLSHCIPNVWISDFLHLMDGRIHLRIAFIALLGHFRKKATGSVSLACRTSRWPSLRLFPPQSEQVNPLEVEKFHSKCPGQSQSSVRIHYGRFVGRMVWSRYQNQAAQKHASYLTQSLHLLHIEGNLPQLLWCEGLSA